MNRTVDRLTHWYFIPKDNFWGFYTHIVRIIVYCITKPSICMYSLNSLHDCQLTLSSEQYPYRLRYYYFSNYSYQQRLFLNPIRKKIYPKKANLELLLKQNYNYKKLILYKNWFAIYFRNKNHNLESIAYYLFDIIYGIKVLRTWRKHLDSKFCIKPI